MGNYKDELSDLMIKYDFALQTLTTELNILIKEYEFNNKINPVEHIKTRIKSRESAIRKLKRKGYEVNRDNLILHVHDMVGVRIVCSFLSDVYDIVKIIKNSKLFKIKSEEDFIKNPKTSGYSSYHLNILVPIHLNGRVEYIEAEIQIRTMAMDFWASLDHKIQYKFDGEIPEEVAEEIYNCSLEVKELDNRMYNMNKIMSKYKEKKFV
ncbi:MAG: GTP pyrophosphokinase family protein [Bacilli bacterium]|nr:GTP pyrophosphokinase family protein [Bacilli bacterium]